MHADGAAGVQLKLVSPNGDDGANVGCTCTGYPGQLTVFVTFTAEQPSQLAHPLPRHHDHRTPSST